MYHDLTKGNISRSLLLFALPMMAGNLLQQFYRMPVFALWVLPRNQKGGHVRGPYDSLARHARTARLYFIGHRNRCCWHLNGNPDRLGHRRRRWPYSDALDFF